MVWPRKITIVRHGQSAGNVALDSALIAQSLKIDLESRDADVPLSEAGHQQAEALGKWFSQQPESEKPHILMASPFVRAVQTAEILAAAGAFTLECPLITDERVREKEFGLLDGLTADGIKKEYPQEAALRAKVGKFYYRPPRGESWCDVVLRLRSLVDSLSLHYADKNVLIVGHQVIVLCLRYLLENLNEKKILDIDGGGDVVNCSLTEYIRHGETLELVYYNRVVPTLWNEAPVTAEPPKHKAGV